MSAPATAREILFPLYAFNVEVARAPWLTSEHMLAEMRLQWWRDVLEEIAQGRSVRRHEIATPLARVLDGAAATALDALVDARRWDIYRDPFADEAAFSNHIAATSGELLWTAARLIGADANEESPVRDIGWAQGLANWFLAIPALEKAGRVPLVDGRPKTIRDLAGEGLAKLEVRPKSKPARGAARAAWRARPLLRTAFRHPERVAQGMLEESEIARRGSLLWRAFLD